MRKRTSLYWLLPAVAGLALIAVAVLLSSASPGGRLVPSAQAQPLLCDLQIDKQQVDVDDIVFRADTVDGASDDDIAYLITVTNVGGTGCWAVTVVDQLPDGLTCEEAGVVELGGVGGVPVRGCGYDTTGLSSLAGQGGEQVTFASMGALTSGETLVLGLIARVDTNDCVTNRACVEAGGQNTPLVNGVCDEVRTCERRHHTPTPTVAPTSTPKPTSTPFVPLPPLPTAKPLGTIAAPPTGSGTDGGSSRWLALGLGLGGVCLLVVSGTALARKRIR
jgi:uncharacterized repeat protein (TIGR01451 family)